MSPIIRNILAIVLGIVLGGALNMGIITIQNFVIPLPEGVDPNNMESLKSSMHLLELRHFIMPFLAHALGTLAGAYIAGLIASTRKVAIAMWIGVFFLLGGIMAAFMLPAPLWFIIFDLVVAYIPMGWLGGRLAVSTSRKSNIA